LHSASSSPSRSLARGVIPLRRDGASVSVCLLLPLVVRLAELASVPTYAVQHGGIRITLHPKRSIVLRIRIAPQSPEIATLSTLVG